MLRRDCYVSSQKEPTFSSKSPGFTSWASHERARLFFWSSLCPARSRDILQRARAGKLRCVPLLWSGVFVSTHWEREREREREREGEIVPGDDDGAWRSSLSTHRWCFGYIASSHWPGIWWSFVKLVDEMENVLADLQVLRKSDDVSKIVCTTRTGLDLSRYTYIGTS